MSSPLYDIVMAFHVLASVVGFGALGSTGSYAAAARRSSDPFSSASLTRYFTPGRNWAARAIVLVPLLGGALLALGHGQDDSSAWPWIGLAVWAVAVGIASAVLWPAERRLQQCLVRGREAPGAADALASAARSAERAAAATSLLFVVAFAVMVWQPV
jgi:uncharacterized membrane protein